jgi:hypothetical protein
MCFPLRVLPGHTSGFTYDQDHIDHISAELGIPWEPSKSTPFASRCVFIGFEWDLSTRRVGLPTQKCEKYAIAIQDWQERKSHSLQEVRRLYGKLAHAAQVVTPGRARLTGMEAMLGTFSGSTFCTRKPPKRLLDDLDWWAQTLAQRPAPSRPISDPSEAIDRQAFSDASSTIGIGITVGDRWRAWRLRPGWAAEGRDIAWAEAIGFEFLARAVVGNHAGPHTYRLYGDNTGVVDGWRNGRSRNRQVNDVFKRIHELLAPSESSISVRYIESANNPADGPSRGVYPPQRALLPHIPIHPAIADLVLDFDAPATPAEVSLERRRAGQQGSHPTYPTSRRGNTGPPQ